MLNVLYTMTKCTDRMVVVVWQGRGQESACQEDPAQEHARQEDDTERRRTGGHRQEDESGLYRTDGMQK